MNRPRDIHDVLAHFPDARKSGDCWKAPCPLGGHQTPKDHTTVRDKGDRATIKCETEPSHDYRAWLTYTGFSSLRYNYNHNNDDPAESNRQETPGPIFAYRRGNGEIAYTIQRFNYINNAGQQDKRFQMDPKGVKERLIYHLPEVVKWISEGRRIYLPEGEGKANAIVQAGGAATATPFGAGAWRRAYAEMLAGAHLVILPDKDPAGRKYAEAAVRDLVGQAASVKVVNLPHLPERGDIVDWFRAGRTFQEVEALADSAPQVAAETMGAAEAKRYEPAPVVVSSHLTDTTNAELIADLFGDRVRFDHRRRRWLVWGGHRWEPDGDGQVRRLAVEAARTRYRQAGDVEDLKHREAVAKWAIGSESRMRLEAATSIAQSLHPIADRGDNWDIHTMLLGVVNGVVDLATGELRPGRPDERISMSTGIEYDPGAGCPRWERFLTEVFPDSELRDWVHRAAGYSLSGDITEQIVFFCHGRGANGKGRFVGGIQAAIGGYAYCAPFSTFELHHRASIPNDLAALELRRFVTSSETNENTRLNEARIKALSGGDPITARFLHAEFSTFMPHLKLWLFVNYKPKVQDDSYGFWRRVRLVPFTRQFAGASDDKRLDDKLRAEAQGILAWLVRGCLEWQRRGLEPVPECVRVATQQYQAESDRLSEFIADACVEHDRATVRAGALYAAYEAWAKGQGVDPQEVLTSPTFGGRMRQRFDHKRTKQGNLYTGIGLV